MQAAAQPGEDTIPPVQPINLLMFGDSIDYRIARHLCNISKHEELLEKFTDDPIGQEHNMTGHPSVLLCTHDWSCCTTGLKDSHPKQCALFWEHSRSCMETVRPLCMAVLRALKAAYSGVQGSAGRQSWLSQSSTSHRQPWKGPTGGI